MWNLFSFKDRLRAFVLAVIAADAERRFPVDLKARLGRLERGPTERREGDVGLLEARIDRLERLLTEHADIVTRDVNAPAFSSPAVSIIMPTWNRARIVGAAIRSVQAQTFADWELLVIDDGSEDDTADVVAGFSADARIRYVRLSHAGQCPARNHGQSIAKGALVAYLDSDNLWYRDFLLAAVNLFVHRRDVDCAYGATVSDIHNPRILFEPFDRERLLAGNFIDMSALIHRRDLIGRYGGFDAKTSPMEDWDMILRYTRHAPAYALPVLAVRYREVDSIRISATEDKVKPLETIRAKWAKPLSD